MIVADHPSVRAGGRSASAALRARLDAHPSASSPARASPSPAVSPTRGAPSALHECDGATRLLRHGVAIWLEAEISRRSRDCFAHARRRQRPSTTIAAGSATGVPAAPDDRHARRIRSSSTWLLTRGHHCMQTCGGARWPTPRGALDEALATLDRRARSDRARRLAGGAARAWRSAHPAVDRLSADLSADLGRVPRARRTAPISSPGRTYPIRYVPIPGQTRDAAPFLYYLFYRSPAPFDRLPVHDYVVTPIDDRHGRPTSSARRLRATNTQRHQAESRRSPRRDRPPRAELLRLSRARRRSGGSPPSTAPAGSACFSAARWRKAGRATRPT